MTLIWRSGFFFYFALLSWQLLTPVTVVNPGGWDKLFHFFGFFVLAVLAFAAWWRVPGSGVKMISILISYAAMTEILQHFIPGRSFSVFDWVADALGIIVAIVLMGFVYSRVTTLGGVPDSSSEELAYTSNNE